MHLHLPYVIAIGLALGVITLMVIVLRARMHSVHEEELQADVCYSLKPIPFASP